MAALTGHVLAGDAVLVDVLPGELMCQICHGCASGPKQCRLGHIYCQSCIVQWLSLKATCPCCNERLTPADLGDNLVARGMIEKLRVHCSNWVRSESRAVDDGLDAKRLKLAGSEDDSAVSSVSVAASPDARLSCAWVGRLESLEAHRKECPCEIVTCNFPACGAKMARQYLSQHEQVCRFALRKCELGCEALVVRLNYDEHLLECPERAAECKLCEWRGPQRLLLEDHSKVCHGAVISCDVCGEQMVRRDLSNHVMNMLGTHVPLLMGKVASLTNAVATMQQENTLLKADHAAAVAQVAQLRSKIRFMTKPVIEERSPEMTPQGQYRVFTFRVPDADRTHYGQYVGFSESVICEECQRSSMQIGFVAERVRPHEAQDDQLGRWVGVEFEKSHVPSVKGHLWIRFQVFRNADPERGVSFTHNYNSDGAPLEFDSDRGAKVGDKWGFIWGRSILLTDMAYANALGPHGGLFVKYYIRFVQSN